jgi:hypothetical protein
MTTKEGEKYTQRADEARLLIDELEDKKEPTEEDLQNIEVLKSKEQLLSLAAFVWFNGIFDCPLTIASADNISIAVEFPLSTAYAICKRSMP